MRVEIFLALLALALGYAAWKGGGPERSMAAILVAMVIADQLLHLAVPASYAIVDIGHLATDLGAFAATFMLAMIAHRFWPIVAAVLQTLPLLAHISRAIELAMHPAAYMVMQVAASWLLPPLLASATWRHQQRLARFGSDRSWQISWRRSNPNGLKA